MKAAFLVRCSTEKQDYERQVNDLSRLAKKLGYETDESIIFAEHITGKDNVIKGTRRSIRRCLEAGRKQLYDVVLISEVSRLSRDPKSGLYFIADFTEAGIPMYFKDADKWTIDPNTGKVDKNAESYLLSFLQGAKKYIESLQIQVASGRRTELYNNCISVGKPALGYMRKGGKDKKTKNQWVVNEQEKEIVQAIFSRYLEDGGTMLSTSLYIYNKYGRHFTTSTISSILSYKPYSTGIKTVQLKDPETDDIEAYDVTIPIIVAPDIFEKATNKRKTNRSKDEPYASQKTYMLSKLIKCPICGYHLTPRHVINKPYVVWSCISGESSISGGCKGEININNDKLEGIIWELIKRELINCANLNTEDRLVKIEKLEKEISNKEMDIANFTKRMSELDKMEDNAYKAFLATVDNFPDIAKAKYQQTINESENEKESCKSNIKNLESDIQRCRDKKAVLESPKVPEEIVNNATEAEKRQLTKELIEKIVPYKLTGLKNGNKTLTKGVVLIEVYTTTDDVYNILLNSNQKKETTVWYINGCYCTYQNGLRSYEAYDKGDFFVLSNANMLTDTDEVDMLITPNEFIEIAENNLYTIKASSK